MVGVVKLFHHQPRPWADSPMPQGGVGDDDSVRADAVEPRCGEGNRAGVAPRSRTSATCSRPGRTRPRPATSPGAGSARRRRPSGSLAAVVALVVLLALVALPAVPCPPTVARPRRRAPRPRICAGQANAVLVIDPPAGGLDAPPTAEVLVSRRWYRGAEGHHRASASTSTRRRC